MTTYDNTCAFLVDRVSFNGWNGRYHRGHAKCVRDAKRAEAEDRNGRPADWGNTTQPAAGACQHPHKTAYPNRDSALAAFNGMPKWRRRQGLNPYQCPAGHWHLGRQMRRSTAAWRN